MIFQKFPGFVGSQSLTTAKHFKMVAAANEEVYTPAKIVAPWSREVRQSLYRLFWHRAAWSILCSRFTGDIYQYGPLPIYFSNVVKMAGMPWLEIFFNSCNLEKQDKKRWLQVNRVFISIYIKR